MADRTVWSGALWGAVPGSVLRVKGGGESGITPAAAVVMNAVMDALSGYGVEHLDMPATAERVWRAIRET